jgi:flagellar hook-length control protein FliK
MKMGDLGNVEIRTQLHHDQLHAEISVERGDLSRTLAAELPALQQKLHEQDMPLASIVINHQAAAGSGSFDRGSQQQQQAYTPMSHVFGVDSPVANFSPDEMRNTETGLDIRI